VYQVAICIYTYTLPYKVQAFTQILYMYSCWERPNLAYLAFSKKKGRALHLSAQRQMPRLLNCRLTGENCSREKTAPFQREGR
jgi:hypothetical protein